MTKKVNPLIHCGKLANFKFIMWTQNDVALNMKNKYGSRSLMDLFAGVLVEIAGEHTQSKNKNQQYYSTLERKDFYNAILRIN